MTGLYLAETGKGTTRNDNPSASAPPTNWIRVSSLTRSMPARTRSNQQPGAVLQPVAQPRPQRPRHQLPRRLRPDHRRPTGWVHQPFHPDLGYRGGGPHPPGGRRKNDQPRWEPAGLQPRAGRVRPDLRRDGREPGAAFPAEGTAGFGFLTADPASAATRCQRPLTIRCIADSCSSIDSTSRNWVRHRSRLCSGRWIRKYLSPLRKSVRNRRPMVKVISLPEKTR
jgi:hypothetical protein